MDRVTLLSPLSNIPEQVGSLGGRGDGGQMPLVINEGPKVSACMLRNNYSTKSPRRIILSPLTL